MMMILVWYQCSSSLQHLREICTIIFDLSQVSATIIRHVYDNFLTTKYFLWISASQKQFFFFYIWLLQVTRARSNVEVMLNRPRTEFWTSSISLLLVEQVSGNDHTHVSVTPSVSNDIYMTTHKAMSTTPVCVISNSHVFKMLQTKFYTTILNDLRFSSFKT